MQLLTFSFFKDGTYLHHEVASETLSEPEFGMEWGRYTFNETTGALLVGDVLYDGNGDFGLVDNENVAATVIATVVEDILNFQITYLVDDTEVTETLIFDRLIPDGIVGTWIEPVYSLLGRSASYFPSLEVVSIFPDGTFLYSVAYDYLELLRITWNYLELLRSVDLSKIASNSGSMEWGTYQRDAQTGKLTLSISHDKEEYQGLNYFADYPDQASIAFNVVDDMLALSFDGDNDGVDDGMMTFFNEYMTIPAPAFSVDFFSDNSFSYYQNEGDRLGFSFDTYNSDTNSGTGSIDYDDGATINDIIWTINEGSLVLTEQDIDGNDWQWTLVPTEIIAIFGYAAVNFEIVNSDSGDVSESGTGELYGDFLF